MKFFFSKEVFQIMVEICKEICNNIKGKKSVFPDTEIISKEQHCIFIELRSRPTTF